PRRPLPGRRLHLARRPGVPPRPDLRDQRFRPGDGVLDHRRLPEPRLPLPGRNHGRSRRLPGGHSFGRRINAAGDGGGLSLTAESRAHAFLHRNGVMVDLNDLIPAGSGWELIDAYSINDRGDIVGYGFRDGGFVAHAFRLSPRTAAQRIDDLIALVRS